MENRIDREFRQKKRESDRGARLGDGKDGVAPLVLVPLLLQKQAQAPAMTADGEAGSESAGEKIVYIVSALTNRSSRPNRGRLGGCHPMSPPVQVP